MKEKFNKISTANVNEMEKDQLDEFSKEVEEFKSKTKFLRNGTLLKTLYMVFGYIFGLCLGALIVITTRNFIASSGAGVKYLIGLIIVGAICIALEVLYRVGKRVGQKYSACITEKEGQIKNRYEFFKMKEDFINSQEAQTKVDSTNKAE